MKKFEEIGKNYKFLKIPILASEFRKLSREFMAMV